jgi:hypothetical protein
MPRCISPRVVTRHRTAFVVPVLAILISLGLSACGSSGTTTSTTAQKLPPVPTGSNNSPPIAVESYLSALSHHNYDVAKKLIYPKVRKAIMAAAGSGFTDLTSLQDVKVLATATGARYKPTVSGVSFSKYHVFAQVTVSYTATFSSSKQPSGPQTKLVTVGENSGSKWIILAIKTG